MFDVLVDHPKKRYYLLVSFFCVLIFGSIIFDLLFAIDLMQSSHFSQLIDVLAANPNSYISYFFYTLLTDAIIYSNDVLGIAFKVISSAFISLNFLDLITLLGIVAFCMSHKNKMSKVTLSVQLGYFLLRILILLGLFFFLYPALMSNDAILALSRIHLVSMVLIGIHVVLMMLTGGYLYNVIKLFYLPCFNEAED